MKTKINPPQVLGEGLTFLQSAGLTALTMERFVELGGSVV